MSHQTDFNIKKLYLSNSHYPFSHSPRFSRVLSLYSKHCVFPKAAINLWRYMALKIAPKLFLTRHARAI